MSINEIKSRKKRLEAIYKRQEESVSPKGFFSVLATYCEMVLKDDFLNGKVEEVTSTPNEREFREAWESTKLGSASRNWVACAPKITFGISSTSFKPDYETPARDYFRGCLETLHNALMQILETEESTLKKASLISNENQVTEGSIPHLFTLFSSPCAVQDDRKSRNSALISFGKGEANHTYLLLLCAVKRYERGKDINTGLRKNKLNLSVKDLQDVFIMHGEKINRLHSDAVWANNVSKNARQKIGMTKLELYSRESRGTAHVVFALP
jgi:hypothetical protein